MDQMEKEDTMEKEDNSCTCCGSLEHETEQCALIDLICELCGMPGHIEKMCVIQAPKTEAGTLKRESSMKRMRILQGMPCDIKVA